MSDQHAHPNERLHSFEVLARSADRDLIRALAKRLAGEDRQAARMRRQLEALLDDESRSATGGIIEALRRSPLVGAGIEFERSKDGDREIEL